MSIICESVQHDRVTQGLDRSELENCRPGIGQQVCVIDRVLHVAWFESGRECDAGFDAAHGSN